MKNPGKYLLLSALLVCTALAAKPLTIFYTGDTHGAYTAKADPATGMQNGGYLVLEETLNQQRQSAARSVYLDSGDQQTGSIFATLVEDGVYGGAVIGVFNRLGLDASVYGNHEFDFSYTNTRDLARLASYPFVCTNLLDRSTGKSVSGTPWTIIERDGLRIGVLGITLELLPEKVKAQNVSSVRILPPADAINMHLDELDRKTDLIIVLSHQGLEADSLLATQLDDRVDIIIGGHDHIYSDSPYIVNGKHLLYSGSHLSFLGKATVDVVDDRVASLEIEMLPLQSKTTVFDTPLAEYVSSRAKLIQEEMSRVIGIIPEDWIPDKYQSTAVSRWVAASLKAEYQQIYKPDLAIINNGGIRKVIPAGQVTLGDMYELLPFNNTVVVFSCYGRDLISLDDLNAHLALAKPHDICEITGLTWDVESMEAGVYGSPDPPKHDSFRVNGIPIDPGRVYRIISHDYIAGQWDKYLGFRPFDVYDTGELILDAMIRQLQLQYYLPEEEGRD